MDQTNSDKASNDILAKVKKLLALGTSPSEAEAASALEKARTLLARYGLSLADVEAHAPEIVEGVLLEKKRLRPWESHLIHVVSLCTFTQALHIHRGAVGQILLIGRNINIQAAQDLFTYLHLIVLKLGRAHSGQVAHLESFKRGVVQRIGERLESLSSGKEESGGPWAGKGEPPQNNFQESTDRQLTLQMTQTATKENQEFIGEKYGKTSTKRVGRRVEAESYHRGRTEGDKVSLNRQLH